MTITEYNVCVHKHADALFRFIVKNVRQEADAQDIIQNAYEKLWLHKDEVVVTTAKTYLFTIAYHKMIDFIRSRKKMVLGDEHVNQGKEVFHSTSTDAKAMIQKALDKLNDTQRMLVMLKDYEGYSYQEIGAIANLTESQVKVYLHRARMIMKNFLISIHTVI
jgi:RNA polymerase sigma factor (sigma-70 family)